MQKAMSIQDLLLEVQRQTESKKDFVTSTKDNIRMVSPMEPGDGPSIVLLRKGNVALERFTISENAHRQIAGRLSVPWKYYLRLLDDHMDMVIDTVNKLFEREPSNRMIRTLDGEVRAFLSDRYLRLDNAEVLSNTLPSIIKGDMETTLLASNVDEHNMHLKVLFTGDDLAHKVAEVRGKDRIIRPGFRLSNSETGGGALKFEAFFFDDYCTNGCVFGAESAFDFKRTHLGGRVVGDDSTLEVFTDETRKLEDQLIISQVNDAMNVISNPEAVAVMVEKLRAAANTPRVEKPIAAVDMAVKELGMTEVERSSVLETFLRDGDYTKWGLASAVTEVANNEDICDFNRTVEIENLGAQILSLNVSAWNKYVKAEETLAA